MPEKATIERARQDAREGKSASTQAGEFVREEIHHIREGKHGASSAKQAIAIGLSKARTRRRRLAASAGRTRQEAAARRAAAQDGGGAGDLGETRARIAAPLEAKGPRRGVTSRALASGAHGREAKTAADGSRGLRLRRRRARSRRSDSDEGCMAKYGRKAQQKVERAMRERKRGTLRSGRLGQESDEPEAGDCDRTLGGAEGRRQSAAEAIVAREGHEEALSGLPRRSSHCERRRDGCHNEVCLRLTSPQKSISPPRPLTWPR